MSISTSELFEQVLDLKDKDRAMLAELLIESLEEKPDDDLEVVWKAEVSHRIGELESGNARPVRWEV